jgi:hypothetical protein
VTLTGEQLGYGSSLHIGVDRTDPEHYAGLKTLRAAEHDARAMCELARGRGFEPCALLLGEDATLEAVRDEIANAASVLRTDDTFLLTFAGHGGIVPDVRGERPVGVDRTMCLYDQQMIEPLLYSDLALFSPGVRVVIITDSCPCVASVRAPPDDPTLRLPKLDRSAAPDGDVRAVPADLSLMIYRNHRATYDAWCSQVRRSPPSFMVPVLALHACQDEQEAREGPMHGRFTGALLAAWDGGDYLASARPSYRDLLDKVTELIGDPTQVPRMSTASADDQRLAYRPPFVLGG